MKYFNFKLLSTLTCVGCSVADPDPVESRTFSKILQGEIEIAAIIPAALNLPQVKISYQQWPRDILIRRNMPSSAWMDIAGLLAANELTATKLETGDHRD